MKYKMVKSEKAEEFVCSNCKKEKKSKNIAKSEVNLLCNGCYGELLMKGKIEKG
jgi:hypothetical protein